MKTPKPLLIFSALGALATASASLAAAVDTSAWKCSACPFEKGSSGSVDAGVGTVSDRSAKFTDMSGLDKGGYLVLGGSARFRDEGGLWGKLTASELGLDTRSLTGQIGREGLFTASLAYDNLPRHFADGAATPYLGNGGGVLTLPAGYPQDTTAAMPLAGTLQPLKLGYDRSRLQGGLSWIGSERWTVRVNARRDERDGTRPGAGAFFATTAQLAVPVDHVTNQLEVSASYVGRPVQATLSYHLSSFSNGQAALRFANPFVPVVAGASTGQLAGAPDNEFHQVAASLGYQLNPAFRASADFAVGRMTQNAAYLPLTLTPGLAASLPALPAASLDGRADTFNGAVRLSYVTPIAGLRLNASYARDVRDSDNVTQTFPSVATDMFVGLQPVTNTPLSFFQDRVKVIADYRASSSLKASAGVEYDTRERSYSEVVTTRETTVWGRVAGQARDDLSLSLKLSRSNRGRTDYGVSTWNSAPQNPLLRKFNLAKRDRVAGAARADWTASETLSIGVGIEGSQDDYTDSVIGLTDGRSLSLAADVAYAFSEATQLRAYGQAEAVQTHQVGSQLYGSPDWTGRVRDRYTVFGVGARHMAMDDKLELGADLTVSRSRSRTLVDTGAATPPFPAATTSLDRLKLSATYQLKDNLSLMGSFWHERYDAADWQLDGVQPDTVPYVLAFGQQAPKYRVNVLQVSVRYSY
ncbi:MAG: MtrB/PioB family decaheme-associated outer membrane protein [Rubrivivax sp.]|nr:MtrB/PioB family decaheme-associated outer membrane protein [Rubrivivax sp.]